KTNALPLQGGGQGFEPPILHSGSTSVIRLLKRDYAASARRHAPTPAVRRRRPVVLSWPVRGFESLPPRFPPPPSRSLASVPTGTRVASPIKRPGGSGCPRLRSR